jgi:hypothetical protein
MADIIDPEKESMREHNSTAPASPMIHSSIDDPEKDEHTSSSPTHTLHSNSSHDTINTDPLEPLEHALTVDLETEEEHATRTALTYTKTGTSIATNGSRIPSFEVDFADGDPEDPRNWPLWYRGLTIGVVSFSTWVVVLYSTSYTSGMPGMMEEFHVTSEPVATLGVTMYLVGLAVGSLILAPLSEIYGRRVVYSGSLLFFTLMVLPCALATSLSEILIVRFFG